MNDKKKPGEPVEEERRAERRSSVKHFISENWHTIVLAAATTIVVRLLLGW